MLICCLKIDRNMFETTLNKLNEFYADAEALSARTYCENCFACLTAYIIYLCMDTHYEKVLVSHLHAIFTGSIAWSAGRQYLIYSEADFEVFRPAGATCCTDGGWNPRQISPSSVQRLGYRSPKLKFLPRFVQNVEYKHPAGAYP